MRAYRRVDPPPPPSSVAGFVPPPTMTVEVQVIIVHNLAGIEGYRRSDDFAVFTGAKKNQSLDIVLLHKLRKKCRIAPEGVMMTRLKKTKEKQKRKRNTRLSSSFRTTVRVESSASSLSTALVRPVDPTSPDTTHRADPSTKSYDGITDTPPLPRKSEERGFFGRRSDPLT